MARKVVSITEVLNSSPFTSYQVLVGILCFCCTLLDGFNLTVIGVAVPKIAEYLRVKPSALGLAMSAGQFGPLIGAALLGMLADRVGRKRMLIACSFTFGLFTLLCAFITNAGELGLFRFIAGLGMGGAVPTAIAFGTEYAPTRSRATLATAMYAGVPAGATASGLAAVYLLPHFGWQSLFVMGGAIPVVIAMVMAVLLPESLTFLVRRGDRAKVRSIVAHIAPAFAKDKDVEFCSTDKKRPGVPVKHLFLEGRAHTTVLLWICFFVGYYLIYLMLSWAPMLLKKSGASIQQYSLAFALINFGSAVATVMVGRLMDKAKNPYRILRVGFVLGFLSLLAFGRFASSPFLVIASMSVLCGLFVAGTVSGLVALVALSYPNDLTGSAVGWAYAVGRSGATLAPLIGGLLIGLNWTVFAICGSNAVDALIIVGIIAILAAHSARVRKDGTQRVLRER
ncbi:MAG: MFS transporter [Syntrophorhabdales bacterium]|jgi:AAHS family 4-hydroxybenzoate transporter-like MFS transporter